MSGDWRALLGLTIVAALVWFFFFHVVAVAQEEVTRTRVSVNVPPAKFHNAKPAITVATPYLRLGDHWTVVNADISIDYVDFGELILNLRRELESRLSDPNPAEYARIDVLVWDSNPIRYVGRVPIEVYVP